ncbi:epoxide hydrolase [Phytohabitans flavus]|uniref:Microsomal epoxide hydrolase n=1 Tax=Phytohabitans flavus TaxID=1076124 RepID=A0A6F8XQK7_9ACTN|nr:epoxide hydrolase [Phytohabitans flavus]BCB76038.1 microsomal epoxide hydrolase [Phytohabitans flavus]
MTPFRIDVPDRDLDDLRDRLARTRWPVQLPGDDWSRGVPVEHLRELADYWRGGFDWRAREAELNAFPQFTTSIDGLDVHFLHARSARPDALPLLLTHGWPATFVEFVRLIPLLTGAFHVVVPSVPGFGWSQAPVEAGFSVGRVARMWAELMARLGYDRYGTQGGDLGAYVAPEVAVVDPEHVVGVHIDGGLGFPSESDVAQMSAAERAEFEEMMQWAGAGVDHHALLRAAPQTFAYGWQDSPAAALAWLAQKFRDFGDVVDRDLFLTNASVYWFTGTFGTSSWPLYDTERTTWPVGQKAVPSGVYSGGPALFRRLAERHNTIVHWPEGNPGGHFVAMEEPEAHAADITAFFAKVS